MTLVSLSYPLLLWRTATVTVDSLLFALKKKFRYYGKQIHFYFQCRTPLCLSVIVSVEHTLFICYCQCRISCYFHLPYSYIPVTLLDNDNSYYFRYTFFFKSITFNMFLNAIRTRDLYAKPLVIYHLHHFILTF